MLDRIICLSEGYVIYDCSPAGVINHFSKYGLKMYKYANPVDKIINIASKPWSELRQGVTTLELAQKPQEQRSSDESGVVDDLQLQMKSIELVGSTRNVSQCTQL